MNKIKASLCLNMIVKNESHVIEKTLTRLTEVFNFSYWVISDTGSTDNTKELICVFFQKLNIPGEIVDNEWRDFGYNRTKALEAAYNKTDYLLIFDADDYVHGNLVLPELTLDMYHLKIGSTFVYKRPLIVNNRLKWQFKGVLHEFLVGGNSRNSEATIEGNYYIESGKSGARSHDPNKYSKDAAILEKAFLTEKDNSLKNRYAFYCAQSYMDANDKEKAIEWYKKVIRLDNWGQEKYYSCLMIGKLSLMIGNDKDAVHYFAKATEFDIQRIENISYLMDYYYKNGAHILVNSIYHKFKNYEKDPVALNDKLFLSLPEYNFQIEYLNSISAYYVNDRESGYICCRDIINSNKAPDYIINNAIKNINFYKDALLLDRNENLMELFVNYNKYMAIYQLDDNCYDIWETLFKKINFSKYIFKPFEKRNAINVFLSMTTCKRYDLFEKTVNSILNQWVDCDKIDYWFLVDDNSSEEDKNKMKINYPFFDFYFKSLEEKGHRPSMNIIWNKLNELKPKYWIHLEDDFVFYDKMEYIGKSIQGLELMKNENVRQILFNLNYGETVRDYRIKNNNGPNKTFNKEFTIHEHIPNVNVQYVNCHYWPHYSFRPSLIDVNVILELGNFDSENQFFEMDYANKWTNAGYKSAFFNKLTNRHIGRLTSERHNKSLPNAYELNNEGQFSKPSSWIKIVNLERRTDRKEEMANKMKQHNILKYDFVKAIDGKDLNKDSDNLSLFLGNDFNSRRGFIGCALSHYNLWQNLVNDMHHNYYLILEDDIEIYKNFDKKIDFLKPEMESKSLIFFGYSMFEEKRKMVREIYAENDLDYNKVSIHRLDKNLYIGGTFCYSINKTGAQHLLNYVHKNGIKHGIDYVMGKLNSEICYESRPSLCHTEWNENGKNVDSDIQNTFDSVELPADNELSEKFIFVKGLDQIGNDLYFHKKSIAESMKIAINDPKCKGFNTLGFFKDKIDGLKPSIYFGGNDGIYVKVEELQNNDREKMNNIKLKINEIGSQDNIEISEIVADTKKVYNVKMICNWCSSEQLCKEWSNMCEKNNTWKNINITSSNENIDYYVIINKPNNGYEYYEPKKTLVFQMEPYVYDQTKNWGVKTWGEWRSPDENKFLYVGTHKKALNSVQWHINVPEFIPEDSVYPEKRLNKLISILSDKNYDEGHIKRIEFVKFLERKESKLIDVYGRDNYHKFKTIYKGKLKDDKKENHFTVYKYCLSVENNSEFNYATEKIWEPILCEQLCFYWGCPNLEQYINHQAFVRLDLDDFHGSLATIKRAIKENWWGQRINIIRREKEKILNELGFFPALQKLINKN